MLYPVPGIAAGCALVADAGYIAVAIRRDARAEFAEDAAWTVDGVSARVTMRLDWAPSDPGAFRLITAWRRTGQRAGCRSGRQGRPVGRAFEADEQAVRADGARAGLGRAGLVREEPKAEPKAKPKGKR